MKKYTGIIVAILLPICAFAFDTMRIGSVTTKNSKKLNITLGVYLNDKVIVDAGDLLSIGSDNKTEFLAIISQYKKLKKKIDKKLSAMPKSDRKLLGKVELYKELGQMDGNIYIFNYPELKILHEINTAEEDAKQEYVFSYDQVSRLEKLIDKPKTTETYKKYVSDKKRKEKKELLKSELEAEIE